jgi:hypothetical protein
MNPQKAAFAQRTDKRQLDEVIEGADLKATRDDARAAIRAAEDALANITTRTPATAVLLAEDPCEAYVGADLMTKRTVVDMLLTIRLLPGHRYSRTFDPETVKIEWKG